MLELALQLVYPMLPQAIIQRMPQYRDRAGFRLNTAHGAREYPPGENVDLQITQFSGDLFRITCLSTDHAQNFEPYRVTYTRDLHGFRNDEPWFEDIDLVVIGDSFTAAESVREPFWNGLAESPLALGLPGSGTLEQSLLLQAFALPRMPETVILAYFAGNDLADNQEFTDLQRQGISYAQHVHRGRNPFDYMVTVHLALFARDMINKSTSANCHYPQTAATSPPTAVAFYDRMVAGLATDQQTLQGIVIFQRTASAVMELANSLQEQGIRFVFMYIPQKAELYWRWLSDESKTNIAAHLPSTDGRITAESIDRHLTTQRDLWASLTDEHSFLFLDLTKPLDEAIENGQTPYFFADTHWNQLGHDIARDALRDFLN